MASGHRTARRTRAPCLVTTTCPTSSPGGRPAAGSAAALILDDAEDAGWIERNLARGRRMREPLERRHHHGTLDVDELLDLLKAAGELDSSRQRPETLRRAAEVRALRDEGGLAWPEVAAQLGIARATAFNLYAVEPDAPTTGVRRAIIATLALAGPRVTKLCMLDAFTSISPRRGFTWPIRRPKPVFERSTSIRGCSMS